MTDAAAPAPPIAYLVSEAFVTDPDGYADYARQVQATLEPFGGRFVVRGGNGAAVVGDPPSARIAVIAFPDRGSALAWRGSEAYARILPLRDAASTSRVYVVDGVEG